MPTHRRAVNCSVTQPCTIPDVTAALALDHASSTADDLHRGVDSQGSPLPVRRRCPSLAQASGSWAGPAGTAQQIKLLLFAEQLIVFQKASISFEC